MEIDLLCQPLSKPVSFDLSLSFVSPSCCFSLVIRKGSREVVNRHVLLNYGVGTSFTREVQKTGNYGNTLLFFCKKRNF